LVMEPTLILVGFMGTGKTEVGKAVWERKGRTFIDIDDHIVQTTGITINDIFKQHGEDAFRELESGMIRKFSKISGLVISTGGGSLLRVQNVDNLKRTGVLVCLTASPEEIARRVADERHRPLLNGPDRIGVVREMLARRSKSYEIADITIDTNGKSVNAAVQEVLDAYWRLAQGWKR